MNKMHFDPVRLMLTQGGEPPGLGDLNSELVGRAVIIDAVEGFICCGD